MHNSDSEYAIFYLSSRENLALLLALAETSIPTNLHSLKKELRGALRTRADLLKCLRQGEILGFIEKSRSGHADFNYEITLRGTRVLKKYLELMEELKPEKECIVSKH